MRCYNVVSSLLVGALIAGCGGSGGEEGGETSPPGETPGQAEPTQAPTATPVPGPIVAEGGELALPENGIQLANDPVLAPAGVEIQKCTYITVELEGAGVSILEKVEAAQTADSHHLVLYYADYTYTGEQPWADGVYDCATVGDPGIAHRVPVYISSVEYDALEFPKAGQTFANPDKDVALMLPAGSIQFVVEQHVINAGDQDVLHRGAINLIYAEGRNPAAFEPAYIYVWGPTDFEIPVGVSYTDGDVFVLDTPDLDTNDDDVPDAFSQYDILYNFGHMHRSGIEYTFEFKPAGSDEWQLLAQDEDWAHPTILKYAPTSALRVGPGAGLRMSCTWFNETSAPLTYPSEMCFSIGYLLFQAIPQGEVDPSSL